MQYLFIHLFPAQFGICIWINFIRKHTLNILGKRWLRAPASECMQMFREQASHIDPFSRRHGENAYE